MNILLCCGAGMSSSLLVTKMQQSSKEQNLDCKIWAVSEIEAKEQMHNADILLIAPQIRYLFKNMKSLGDELRIPVELINITHYGTCNGREVLNFAIQTINKYKI